MSKDKGFGLELYSKPVIVCSTHHLKVVGLLQTLYQEVETLIQKQDKIKEILKYRENAFDGNEFGATYSDLDNIIEQISEIINS